ncbi:MAG: hypothetical protein IJY25_04865 [Bacilli bacterium]|nr:hypothetical protein [Bacilli bacterium]
MDLLKKENWWIWLLLALFSNGSSTIVLGAMLNLFDKNAWYTKWYIWVVGLILMFPFVIMIYALIIDITTKTAAKLDVKGKDYYLSPFIWIILLIIPFIGWLGFIALFLYLNIAILVQLYDGKGEKYIK